MPDDPTVHHVEAEHRRLVGAPLDPDVLTTVIDGVDRLGSWELRDGPHAVPQDPDAVRNELIVRHGSRGGGVFSGIGPRLRTGQIALVGTAAQGVGDYRIGYLTARCRPSVATVRVRYQDGTTSELPTAVSTTTGEGWAVCPLDTTSTATHIEFLNEAGTTLDTRAVQDPRTRPDPG